MKKLTEQDRKQYAKLLSLPEYGGKAQAMLKQAKILVVGAGGLGSAVLPSLVSAGIGEIGIVEYDTVSTSNLPRQLLYTPSEEGQSKLTLALRKLHTQNPSVQLNGHECRLEATNAEAIISSYQLVMDCTDNFASRYLINDTCARLHKPLVYGAMNEVDGHIALFHGAKGSSLRQLFPEPPEITPATGILPHLPMFVGSLMVNEAVHFLCNKSHSLDGKFLIVNLQTHSVQKISLC